MTPEEKKARAALENIPVANYASVEVFLDVAVRIIARAIREAVAEQLERDCAAICPGCAGSWAPATPDANGRLFHASTGANKPVFCKAAAIRAQAKQGMNKETI